MIMKKIFKSISTIALSAALAASAGVMTAMPAVADYTVTITKPESDKATHTYEAYQVFTGKLHGSGDDVVLSDIEWGSGVDGAALLTALKGSVNFGSTNPFADKTDAKGVASVLDEWTDNAENLQKFADIVSQHLSASPTVSGTAGNPKLTLSDAGYYFIKDKDGSLNDENGAYTDYILKVVNSVEVNAKEDVPSITKKILENTELKEANTASVGDTVTFQVDSKVPDMSAYNKYYYVINDTMCQGLTFEPASVKVYIDGTQIDSGNYEVQTEKAQVTPYTFQIVMKDFKDNYADKSGKDIKVTYDAVLNDKADRSIKGNDNTVNLTYSNNPNFNYTGNNEPKDTEPKGITPDSKTKTYTTGIMLTKIDGSTKAALTGAEFQLKGSGVNNVIITSSTSFTEDADGEFYKLTDGSYTKTPPTDETKDKYEAGNKKYTPNSTTVTHEGDGDTSSVTQAVDANGVLTFEGLGTGTYTLTETKAPDMYNSISPITINITANPDLNGPNWSITKNGEAITLKNGIYAFEIENNKGATLPGTGGIGTTIFYVVGGLLISGALVLLITKKRMNIKEK
jgi:fimbrial isopeptide formation D2 family protein/LPXTG-motif cell wall-anchored protein